MVGHVLGGQWLEYWSRYHKPPVVEATCQLDVGSPATDSCICMPGHSGECFICPNHLAMHITQ